MQKYFAYPISILRTHFMVCYGRNIGVILRRFRDSFNDSIICSKCQCKMTVFLNTLAPAGCRLQTPNTTNRIPFSYPLPAQRSEIVGESSIHVPKSGLFISLRATQFEFGKLVFRTSFSFYVLDLLVMRHRPPPRPPPPPRPAGTPQGHSQGRRHLLIGALFLLLGPRGLRGRPDSCSLTLNKQPRVFAQ